ncbi:MAG TPA: hypothetical protein PK467_14565, partial [Candidatus Wallbacteria bacterium]|nr:hypothetical protein [Candidatus Wallbacteria bacterium]
QADGLTNANGLKIRIKAAGTTQFSATKSIAITDGPAAPSFTNATAGAPGTLAGLPASATNLEGNVNSGVWTALVVDGSGNSTTLTFISTDTINVRVKATSTTQFGTSASQVAP